MDAKEEDLVYSSRGRYLFLRSNFDRFMWAAIAVIGVTFLGWCAFRGPGYISRTRRLQKEMSEKLDVQSIRDWMEHPSPKGLAEWMEHAKSLTDDQTSIDRKHWPPALSVLKPVGVYLSWEKGMFTLRFFWGGGLVGQYGGVVGPSSMPTPSSSKDEYRLPLVPGAYVWHEIQH